jgi:predicted AAA+ superfamily ATPase
MHLEGTGFPVGKVDMLTLYPLSFYEFLAAVDGRFLENLRSLDFKCISSFHGILTQRLKQYFYVGGMPAAVSKYTETKSFAEMHAVQTGIAKLLLC